MAKPSTSFSLEVIKLIDYIISKNNDCYSLPRATLLTVMYVYSYERPVLDLIHILSEYPNLGSKDELGKNIDYYIEKKYLVLKRLNHIMVCTTNSNLPEMISNDLNDANIQLLMEKSREIQDHNLCAEMLGSVSNKNYTSYINRLCSAQEEICLPLLNTAPYEDLIEALKDRADAGVKIKILFADKKISTQIRMTVSMLNEWQRIFNGFKNVEIRIFHNIEDTILCSSILIDNSILRLVAFDPFRQKSSNGTLIEYYKCNYNINIISMFKERFAEAWHNAARSNQSKFQQIFSFKITITIFVTAILILLYFLINVETVKTIIIGVLGALIWDYVAGILPKIKGVIKRFKNVFKKPEEL